MGKSIENDAEESIATLKAAIKDIINEDNLYGDEFYLLRWLKASSMKVTKAEKNLRNTAKWRKEMNVSSLYDASFPENWLELMPIYVDAVTTNGSIAATVQGGLVDIRGIIEERGRKDVVKLLVQTFVQVERVLMDLNRNKFGDQALSENSIEGTTLLLDLDQFSARQLRSFEVIQTVGEVCKDVVTYFPFLCAKIIVVNCNSFASVLLKIMRSIMESPTLKFEVHGQDKAEWHEAVTSQIPAHLLRDIFGGTRPTEEKIKRDVLIDRNMLLSYAQQL